MSPTEYAVTFDGSTAAEIDMRFAYVAESWSSIPDHVSRAIPPVTDRSQTYYWTRIWQEGERETLAELAAGNGRRFSSAIEAISWLLSREE